MQTDEFRPDWTADNPRRKDKSGDTDDRLDVDNFEDFEDAESCARKFEHVRDQMRKLDAKREYLIDRINALVKLERES